MRIISRDDSDAVEILGSCILDYGIAIVACDTIYGIVGRAPETEGKIRDLKGRDEGKPFLVLAESGKAACAHVGRPIDSRLLELWPAPLTVVVEGKQGGTVGIRVPDDGFLSQVLARVGLPVFSTSVNRAGEPAMWRIADIAGAFGDSVDLILDSGDLPGGISSTVLDATSRPYRLLRQGGFEVPASLLL